MLMCTGREDEEEQKCMKLGKFPLMPVLQFRFYVSSCPILSLLFLYDDSKRDAGLWHYLVISRKRIDDCRNPLVLNEFYCCPSLALPSFPYASLRAAMQPCFIVMLIDRRPSDDVVKDNGEAVYRMQLLLRAWLSKTLASFVTFCPLITF